MIKTLILDFDGTIGDTRKSILDTMQATLRELQLPKVDDSAIISLIGLPLSDTFVRAAGLTDPEQIQNAIATYRRLFGDICKQTVTSFPHVTETLAEVHSAGVTIAIASSRGKESLRVLCDRLGISQYISMIVAEEDVVHKKPAPDMVRLILDRTNTAPDEALVVGDTQFDIEMGRGANCKTCAVTYGNHTIAQLQESQPDHIIDDFSQLLSIALHRAID